VHKTYFLVKSSAPICLLKEKKGGGFRGTPLVNFTVLKTCNDKGTTLVTRRGLKELSGARGDKETPPRRTTYVRTPKGGGSGATSIKEKLTKRTDRSRKREEREGLVSVRR